VSNGIILAGGRGSRLGPLSTQISKALVSIGQRPHIFHQIELLRAAGCKHIIVTVSPSTQVQVISALDRAGLYDIGVVIQHTPAGPVDAILTALNALTLSRREHDTYVLMSDTFIEEPLERSSVTWFGVAPALSRRSFCVRDLRGDYIDCVVQAGTSVTIGAYHFADTTALFNKAAALMASKRNTAEVGMGPLLSLYLDVKTIEFPTWLDIGDAMALSSARRTRFIARSEHKLSLSRSGLLIKRGKGKQILEQRNWMLDQAALPDDAANLVPRIFSTLPDGYTMEYIDLPTLAELWLYWPGMPETWAAILQSVTDRLERDLWWRAKTYNEVASPVQVASWFAGKALERLTQFDHAVAARHFDLLERASEVFTSSSMVRAHGDLNFNNILYSINTGTCKLIDPRGTSFMPLNYELAKLRYSYHAGFSAITHGLFDPETGTPLPDRGHEIAAMDDFLNGYVSLEQLQVAEGCLLLAGAPLHSKFERDAMIARGVQFITEVVG